MYMYIYIYIYRALFRVLFSAPVSRIRSPVELSMLPRAKLASKARCIFCRNGVCVCCMKVTNWLSNPTYYNDFEIMSK